MRSDFRDWLLPFTVVIKEEVSSYAILSFPHFLHFQSEIAIKIDRFSFKNTLKIFWKIVRTFFDFVNSSWNSNPSLLVSHWLTITVHIYRYLSPNLVLLSPIKLSFETHDNMLWNLLNSQNQTDRPRQLHSNEIQYITWWEHGLGFRHDHQEALTSTWNVWVDKITKGIQTILANIAFEDN